MPASKFRVKKNMHRRPVTVEEWRHRQAVRDMLRERERTTWEQYVMQRDDERKVKSTASKYESRIKQRAVENGLRRMKLSVLDDRIERRMERLSKLIQTWDTQETGADWDTLLAMKRFEVEAEHEDAASRHRAEVLAAKLQGKSASFASSRQPVRTMSTSREANASVDTSTWYPVPETLDLSSLGIDIPATHSTEDMPLTPYHPEQFQFLTTNDFLTLMTEYTRNHADVLGPSKLDAVDLDLSAAPAPKFGYRPTPEMNRNATQDEEVDTQSALPSTRKNTELDATVDNTQLFSFTTVDDSTSTVQHDNSHQWVHDESKTSINQENNDEKVTNQNNAHEPGKVNTPESFPSFTKNNRFDEMDVSTTSEVAEADVSLQMPKPVMEDLSPASPVKPADEPMRTASPDPTANNALSSDSEFDF